jgi:hypothetical protein
MRMFHICRLGMLMFHIGRVGMRMFRMSHGFTLTGCQQRKRNHQDEQGNKSVVACSSQHLLSPTTRNDHSQYELFCFRSSDNFVPKTPCLFLLSACSTNKYYCMVNITSFWAHKQPFFPAVPLLLLFFKQPIIYREESLNWHPAGFPPPFLIS